MWTPLKFFYKMWNIHYRSMPLSKEYFFYKKALFSSIISGTAERKNLNGLSSGDILSVFTASKINYLISLIILHKTVNLIQRSSNQHSLLQWMPEKYQTIYKI